jgi:hypothetical protein
MSKMKALVFKGPKVVGKTINYAIERTRCGWKGIPFDASVGDYLEGAIRVGISLNGIRASVKDFKAEWRGKKPSPDGETSMRTRIPLSRPRRTVADSDSEWNSKKPSPDTMS